MKPRNSHASEAADGCDDDSDDDKDDGGGGSDG